MRLFTRVREGKFWLIFGRMEIDALIGLFRSMAVRAALPRIFSFSFKLRLGTPLPGETLFRGDGVSARGIRSVPQTPPPWEMQFPYSLHYQTEFGNEGGTSARHARLITSPPGRTDLKCRLPPATPIPVQRCASGWGGRGRVRNGLIGSREQGEPT